jgi:M6 family metalloprotease-like protein
LTVISATADNGAVIINPDFTLKYTPNLNYNGTDTINYTIKDIIDVATSTVSVDVTPINDAPQLSEILDKFIDTGVALIIDVATLASDVDGDTLSYSLTTTNPFTTIDSTTGVLNISPLSTDSGNFVITISVTDGYLSHQQSFTLTVTQTYSISEAAQSFTRIDAGFNETTFPAPISPVSPFKLAMNSFVLPTTYDHDYNSTTTTYDLAWSSTNDSISFLTENVVSFSHPSANDLNEDIQLTATLSKLSEIETQTLNLTLNAKIKISTPQLVIRVKFTDTNFISTETGDYERVFGSSESNGIGSTKEFLLENSRGFSDIVPVIPDVDLEIANQLINNGTIVDSITDDGVIEYYTQTTSIEDGLLISPSNELLNRILVDVDKYIDFSRFDSNGDGHIASSELDIILNFAICNRASSASYCYPYLDPSNTDFSKPGFWPASRPGYVGGWGFTTYNNAKQIGNILESRITWITDYDSVYNSGTGTIDNTVDSNFDILTHEIAHNLYNIPDLYNLNTNNWVAPWNQHNLSIMRWGLLSSTGFAEINGSLIGYPQTMTAYNKSILGFIDPIISTPYSRGLTGQTIDLKSLYLSPNAKPIFITNISTGELGDPWGVSYSPKLDNHQNMILGHQVIVAEYKSNSYDPDMGYDKAIIPSLVTVTADISSEAFSSDLLNADSKTPGVLITLANPTQISTGNTYATHAGQLKVNIIPKSEKIYESSGVMDDVLFKTGDQLTTCTKFHTQTSVSSDVNELHNTITGFKITDISESVNYSFSITIENQDGTETCSKDMDY